jgi:O-antigen ligase
VGRGRNRLTVLDVVVSSVAVRGDGLMASIGLLVVVQNIFTSLFNSHLFDFHEGWMYVGVAGGTALRRSSYHNNADPDDGPRQT